MKDHIIEFTQPGTSVSKYRGLLTVARNGERTEIPLDDVFGVIILSEDMQISTNVIVALLERGVVLQFCDGRYMPCGVLSPFVGHSMTKLRQEAQINLSDTQRGRLWQTIVAYKIRVQAQLLEAICVPAQLLKKFAAEVRVHDESNLEAQAARIYWSSLFGKDFKRDPSLPGLNSFLNYGYAIVRSAVARYTVACGLNPAIGLFHRNQGNPFCLVDDLMEPFRPVVDQACLEFREQDDLSTEIKRSLAFLLEKNVVYRDERKPLRNALQEYCQSFTRAVIASDWKRFDAQIEIN